MTVAESSANALAKKIVSAMPEMDATEQRVVLTLYRELATGEPVSLARLAAQAGVSRHRVSDMLKQWPVEGLAASLEGGAA